ncbi:MAG: hypothetical protein KDJ35_04015 [Alphaproteobacteria bacterium]|nr:hypothetical protein [Alphaproteobacteria bacterium]
MARKKRKKKFQLDAQRNLSPMHPSNRRYKNPNVFHFTRHTLNTVKKTSLKEARSSIGYLPLSRMLVNILTAPEGKNDPLVGIFEKVGVMAGDGILFPKTDDIVENKIKNALQRISDFLKNSLRSAIHLVKGPKKIEMEFDRAPRILVDKTLSREVSAFLNSNFAPTFHQTKAFKRHKGFGNPELYKGALHKGFNVLISADFKMDKPEDALPILAREAFRDCSVIQNKYHVSARGEPVALIVVPEVYNTQEKIQLLTERKEEVAKFISNPTEPVLYLA